ncbi:ATP-grasp domain-containing protein [Clostridium botulinum]|uniref:ATP-grasp domain-containing protein n=1 Tax=Clostridium botulinum TaxID=1491 RepID=UPI000597B3C4|nr:ATP-grasp domain-containing protein [Clostridium botulinum]KIL07066.1 hypothetical protein SR42_12755 [Clostridium botulinum]MBN1041919.1 ATP-grasp domain-containing protein [Clostridium botulinum]MBY6838963.1 ATP-grasp domain-containing protein [Clostridium botulinum]MBY6934089.1 ATP-grasp domain-containing protein [Clostridium botulinum]NFG64588.1 ATP-grasp domain-containing protein [Clostridium botulinum]
MLNKRILFIEPSFYGVNLVKAAKELYCEVVVIVSSDQNPIIYGYEGLYDDLLVCDIKSIDSIYKTIIKSKYYKNFDALIPGYDYVTAATAKVSELLDIKGTSYQATLTARNKDMARDIFLKNNVPSAKYAVITNYTDALKASNLIGYPVVLKPTNAAGSQNVSYIKDEDSLLKAFNKISKFKTSYLGFSVRQEYLIEEYLIGPEFSVELFLNEGSIEFAEITEKHTSDLPYFVERLHIFPSSICQEVRDNIIDVAKKAVFFIGIQNGPTHVEIKYTNEGPKIIEVNGRPGGDNITSDLIINSYGINIYKETIKMYLSEPLDMEKKNDIASAIGYILSEKKGKVKTITGLENLPNDKNVTRYQIDVKENYEVNISRSSEERLGYIIITAETSKEAKNKIEKLLKEIKITYFE